LQVFEGQANRVKGTKGAEAKGTKGVVRAKRAKAKRKESC